MGIMEEQKELQAEGAAAEVSPLAAVLTIPTQALGGLVAMGTAAVAAFVYWCKLTVDSARTGLVLNGSVLNDTDNSGGGSAALLIALGVASLVVIGRESLLSFDSRSRLPGRSNSVDVQRIFDLLAAIFSVNVFGCMYVIVGNAFAVAPAGLVLLGTLPFVAFLRQQFAAKCSTAQRATPPSTDDSLSVISAPSPALGNEEVQIESLENEARLLAALAEREVPALRSDHPSLAADLPSHAVTANGECAGDADRIEDPRSTEETVTICTQTSAVTSEGMRVDSGEALVQLADDERQKSLVIQFASAFSQPPDVDIELEEDGVRATVVNCTPLGCRLAIKRAASGPSRFVVAWSAGEQAVANAAEQKATVVGSSRLP
jgi:hypothetical protein